MKNNFNPPFSLFREYVKQLMDYGKKFIIIGSKGAIGYQEIFKHIENDEMWIGVTPMGTDLKFILPEHFAKEVVENKAEGSGYVIKDGQVLGRAPIAWYTNVEHKKRNTPLDLYKRYSNEYPHYENYDAIEVGKTTDIPIDFDGVMGVPISFLDKYCPAQFKIIGIADRKNSSGMRTKVFTKADSPKYNDLNRAGAYYENGTLKGTFTRILIRKRTA